MTIVLLLVPSQTQLRRRHLQLRDRLYYRLRKKRRRTTDVFINEFLNFNASFEMSAEEIICLVILILYSKYGLIQSMDLCCHGLLGFSPFVWPKNFGCTVHWMSWVTMWRFCEDSLGRNKPWSNLIGSKYIFREATIIRKVRLSSGIQSISVNGECVTSPERVTHINYSVWPLGRGRRTNS